MSEAPLLQVGAEAKCEGLRGSVRILEGPSKKGEYRIGVGNLSMWVKASRLTPLSTPSGKSKRKKSAARTAAREPSMATLRLDLHGLKAAEAERQLEEILDRALLEGAERIEVIHGIGSGVLRKVVERFCRNSRQIANSKPDERNPGSYWIYL